MKAMDKRIMVSLPSRLYKDIKAIAEKEYRSVSSLIREAVLDKIEEEFTAEEMALVEKGHKSFRAGNGINWRKARRD